MSVIKCDTHIVTTRNINHYLYVDIMDGDVLPLSQILLILESNERYLNGGRFINFSDINGHKVVLTKNVKSITNIAYVFFTEIVNWISVNCTDKWYFTIDYDTVMFEMFINFYFENKNTATIFKLSWG